MSLKSEDGLSRLEYHVLLAVADRPLYGYAIRDAVEEESGGAVAPRAGTLYRVIARLLTSEHVVETDGPDGVDPHPGRERRYYELTPLGRSVLAEEARRLRVAASLAEERLSIGRP